MLVQEKDASEFNYKLVIIAQALKMEVLVSEVLAVVLPCSFL